MKKIEAIIREERLEPVKMLLEAIGYHGMAVTEVSGAPRFSQRLEFWLIEKWLQRCRVNALSCAPPEGT